MFNFIKVEQSGDLKWLIIEGTPSEASLSAAWADILDEYNEAVSSKPSEDIILYRDVAHLDGKLKIVQSIITQLTNIYDERLIEFLHDYGFQYSYSKETLLDDLNKTISQAKSWVVQRNIKATQLEKKKGNFKPIDYGALGVEMSKFQGYPIKTKDTTVKEFLDILKQYNEEIDRKNKAVLHANNRKSTNTSGIRDAY